MGNTTCWGTNANGTVEHANFAPCGPLNSTNPQVSCCARGDQCLSDNICHRDGSSKGASGYYTAGCTDEAYGPGCSNRCGKCYSLLMFIILVGSNTRETGGVKIPEINFNPSTNLWYCCGMNRAGKSNCDTPVGGSFSAPAPANLLVYYTAPASGSATAVTSSGLSAGAQAGIGVGVAIFIIATVGFAATILMRRRRKKLLLQNRQEVHQQPLLQAKAAVSSARRNELYAGSNVVELGQRMPVVEMSSEQDLPSALGSGLVELDGHAAPRN
jgi:hypothetical protein